MNNNPTAFLDTDLTRQDVQALSSPVAVTAFFARLGYNTDARTTQTAGNLGITADSTVRPIKKIELIADQEGLLQVYLFELQSVTVAHTRALARAFRNRAGNYLLILTSDFDRLDFVLLFIGSGLAFLTIVKSKHASIYDRVISYAKSRL